MVLAEMSVDVIKRMGKAACLITHALSHQAVSHLPAAVWRAFSVQGELPFQHGAHSIPIASVL
jgi:hypothetical protein